VDIIALKGKTLAIVEVKWRSNTYFGDPQSFVSKKTTTIPHHGVNHCVNFNHLDVSVRFDVVSIVGQQSKIDVQIIENAFYPFPYVCYL
jgi:putative endonuclease